MQESHTTKLFIIVLLVAVISSCNTSTAYAQVRGSVNFSQVGSIRGPGGSGSVVSSFRETSYGVSGGGNGGVAGRGGDILSTSPGANNAFRPRGGAGGTGVTPEDNILDVPRQQRVIRYAPTNNAAITELSPEMFSISSKTSSRLSPFTSAPVYTGGSAAGVASSVQEMAGSRNDPGRNAKSSTKSSIMFSPVDVYLEALGVTSILSAERNKPITSLAVSDGSRYSIYMKQGEQYFRTGDYVHAFTEFQMASIISNQDPSSLISMAHASFTMSRESYTLAASYIRQVIRVFPDLPLTRLQPRGFFGRPNDYAKNLTVLEDHVRDLPGDIDSQFLLAYYRWFDGDAQAAKDCLSKAYTSTTDPLLQKDIETFWEGMKASGKVSGSLGQAGSAARPVSTSRPAPVAPVATEQPPQAAVPQ